RGVGAADLAHGVQRPVDGRLRHWNAAALRLDQEVGGVGAQPWVGLAVAHPPEPEGPVDGLPVEQLAPRLGQRRRGRAGAPTGGWIGELLAAVNPGPATRKPTWPMPSTGGAFSGIRGATRWPRTRLISWLNTTLTPLVPLVCTW